MLCVWKIRPYGQELLEEIGKERMDSRDTAGVGKKQ